MTKHEVILKIKDCIREAHSFSGNLGDSTSIHRDHLIKSLEDISSSDIQAALLELKDNGQIRFAEDEDIILLTDTYGKD